MRRDHECGSQHDLRSSYAGVDDRDADEDKQERKGVSDKAATMAKQGLANGAGQVSDERVDGQEGDDDEDEQLHDEIYEWVAVVGV